jgi:hypothetical protein
MSPPNQPASTDAGERARLIRAALPEAGLFDGQSWRISPEPFALGPELAREFDSLGRVLLQFYRAVNLLYRRSAEGKAAPWIHELLDRGKPPELIALQRHPTFKNELPRVIRPDILLAEEGFAISELDSVPGGIGLTQWLNQTYAALESRSPEPSTPDSAPDTRNSKLETRNSPAGVLGGATGMSEGFAGIFGDARRVQIVVSEESASYRPEMAWLVSQLEPTRFVVRDTKYFEFAPGDAVYRFFELFDLANVGNSGRIFELASGKAIRLTPPPKPIFEEKLLFALLWNRNLRDYWRQELGESFFNRLLGHVPRTWILDPTPLPPSAAYPGLELTDWRQLKNLSQRERELILKVSGFSERAWGARGVFLGNDLSSADWSAAVDQALAAWSHSPWVLQRFHRPRLVEASWYDFDANRVVPMPGRVRLCPYFFVHGEGDAARPKLGGVLATIVPADKKIVHGMKDGILAPCIA